jgi:hypothetical protein
MYFQYPAPTRMSDSGLSDQNFNAEVRSPLTSRVPVLSPAPAMLMPKPNRVV